VAVTFDRGAIQAALAMVNPAASSYLDLETGTVVTIDEEDSSAENAARRDQVMDGYGDRFRYIPGGNTSANAATVTEWLATEGL